jgi:hypothetical protein
MERGVMFVVAAKIHFHRAPFMLRYAALKKAATPAGIDLIQRPSRC